MNENMQMSRTKSDGNIYFGGSWKKAGPSLLLTILVTCTALSINRVRKFFAVACCITMIAGRCIFKGCMERIPRRRELECKRILTRK